MEVAPTNGSRLAKLSFDGVEVYVNAPGSVPLWESGLFSTTSTASADRAAVVAMIVLEFTNLTFVAACPPIVTVAPFPKPIPTIVTGTPPSVVPAGGIIEVTVGGGARM
jgi:hypothetical protein